MTPAPDGDRERGRRDSRAGAGWEGTRRGPGIRRAVAALAALGVLAVVTAAVIIPGMATGGRPDVGGAERAGAASPAPGIGIEPDSAASRPETPPLPRHWQPGDGTPVLPDAAGTLYTLRGGAIVGVVLGTGQFSRMPLPGTEPDSLVATDDGAVAVSSGHAWGWSADSGAQPRGLGSADRVLPGGDGPWLIDGDELRRTGVDGLADDVRTIGAHEDAVAVADTYTVVERRAGYQEHGRGDPGLSRPLRAGTGPSQTRRVSPDRFGAGRRLHTSPRHVVWATCETNRTCTLGVDALDGTDRRRLPLPIEAASVSEVWARAAAAAGRVAVVTAESSRNGQPRTVLSVLDVESGATWAHPLAPSPAAPPTLAWSTDGEHLAYRTASGNVALWRLSDDAIAILGLPTGPAAAIALQ